MKAERLDGSLGNAGVGMLREVCPDPRNAGRGDSASPEWRRAS